MPISTYLNIWFIRLLGIENFKNTLKKRIIIKGRGARIIDNGENLQEINS